MCNGLIVYSNLHCIIASTVTETNCETQALIVATNHRLMTGSASLLTICKFSSSLPPTTEILVTAINVDPT